MSDTMDTPTQVQSTGHMGGGIGRADEKASGFLGGTPTAKLVLFAAVLFVLAFLLEHVFGAFGRSLDFKPNDNNELNFFKKLFMISSWLGMVVKIVYFAAWGLFLWACAREIGKR